MKQIKAIALLSLAAGFLLVACSAEEPVVKQDPALVQEKNPYRKSLGDALGSAEMIFADISEKPQTRASRQIESVQIIGNNNGTLTRSGEENTDTMFYLVNYADDQGFALLSADRRTKPVYAISDEGELNLSDTTFNKGLALFMENAIADYECSVTENPKGPFIPNDSIDINNPYLPKDDYEYTLIYHVKPILKHYPSRWNQMFPFNKYVVANEGGTYPVGCVAVALAQLCSAAGGPIHFEGRTLDWNLINQTSTSDSNSKGMDDLAFFMWKAGDKYLKMDYKIGQSGAKFGKIHSFLCDMNFNSSGQLTYNGSVPNDAYPVAICGRPSSGKGGHAWILDGGLSYKITGNMCEGGYAYFHFEHCVWGWGGSGNGYYSWNPNCGFGSAPHHYGEDDDESPNSGTGDYVRDFEYIYIKK